MWKTCVWRGRGMLKGRNISIREDLSRGTLEIQKNLYPYVRKAHELGKQCSIHGESLYLEGKFYHAEYLHTYQIT